MTKKLWTVAGILAAAVPAVVLLGGFRAAGGFRHGRDPELMARFIEWRINEKLTDIKATDAQKQAIRAIEKRLEADAKALHKENRGVRASIVTELEQDSVDAAKIHALIDARAAAMKGFADKVVDGVIEAHDVLTPEQRKQFFAEMQARIDKE